MPASCAPVPCALPPLLPPPFTNVQFCYDLGWDGNLSGSHLTPRYRCPKTVIKEVIFGQMLVKVSNQNQSHEFHLVRWTSDTGI